jgi:hypothetical protein
VRQTGTHRRIIFGELDGQITSRVERIRGVCQGAGIEAVPSSHIRRDRWEKFIMLVAISGLCALARRPIGDLRDDPDIAPLIDRLHGMASRAGEGGPNRSLRSGAPIPRRRASSRARQLSSQLGDQGFEPAPLHRGVGRTWKTGENCSQPRPTANAAPPAGPDATGSHYLLRNGAPHDFQFEFAIDLRCNITTRPCCKKVLVTRRDR